MSELLRYYAIDELKKLSVDELKALWELVPTDRQRMYRAAYEREVKNAGAEGSDARERDIAAALITRYLRAALVPVGMRWARTPQRVQEVAVNGDGLDAPDKTAVPPAKPSLKIIMPLLMVSLMMVVLLLMRGTGEQGSDSTTEVANRGTSNVTMTPLALEAQDEVIAGGDANRAPFYPINLQISLEDGAAPRVWVVQRRAVRASAWNYDLNPDTASYLNGMSVRPVIGIPWSAENAAWFEDVSEGSIFNVQMNTGAILTFMFEEKRDVRRSDTGIFRQVTPGLVLLLLGEADEDGLPTASRTLITAEYALEQELGRSGELVGLLTLPTSEATPTLLPTATPTPLPFPNLEAQVISVETIHEQVNIRVRLYNGGREPIVIAPDDIWLALGYAENPPGPRVPVEVLVPFTLLADQAADIRLEWPWDGEPFASLGIGEWRFAVQF